MHAPERITLSCSSCDRCPTESCPANTEEEQPRLRGRALGLAAGGLFLGPIALAVAGSACVGDEWEMQLVGALAGLLFGICIALACVKVALKTERGGA